jgi:hypothetical protein
MAFDFPASPTVGQLYPSPALANASQYYWDGSRWVTWAGPQLTKNVVYTDGSAPMTGQLTVLASPTHPTDAASKAYVDAQVSSGVPSGTIMLFWQASAPVGWTIVTSQNDKAIRVVSGSGGVAGGTNPFSTVQAQTATGAHTLGVAELPTGLQVSGSPTITVYPGGNNTNYVPTCSAGFSQNVFTFTGTVYAVVAGSGGGSSMSYTATMQGVNTITLTASNTSGSSHTHPLTMSVQYIDVILCSKN